jgi:hypothetical protein
MKDVFIVAANKLYIISFLSKNVLAALECHYFFFFCGSFVLVIEGFNFQ